MRLSRTDFVPVLAIVAGGMIGASLSFSFLELRSADEVRVVGTLFRTSATPEMGIRVEHPNSPVVERIQPFAPNGRRRSGVLHLIDSDGENWLLTIPESAGSVRSLGLLGVEIESLQKRYEEAQGRLERDRGEHYENVTIFRASEWRGPGLEG